MSTNITPAHRDAFEALTSGDYDNLALFSCFVNGDNVPFLSHFRIGRLLLS